jgi:hypothetical protein
MSIVIHAAALRVQLSWRLWARLVVACCLTLALPGIGDAVTGSLEGASGTQLNLPQDMGWHDWRVVRDQHARRATVKVFVRTGEAPQTAKVRVVLTQMPKPTFDSPQSILDALLKTARQQCEKVSATPIRKSPQDLIFELRGFGCAGQKGERYLLQRIAFIGEWELQATYAPMTPMDDLPRAEKNRAIRLLASVTIAGGPNGGAESGWFLITPPQKADGHYDSSAPLSKWKIEEGAGSQAKCQEVQTFLTSVVQKKGGPGDLEQVRDARCIPMDDPRLDQN